MAKVFYEIDGHVFTSREKVINYLSIKALDDPKSAKQLADIYASMKGTANQTEATIWYTNAADDGHVEAMGIVAFRYLEGEGADVDLEKAIHYAFLAAKNGDIETQNSVFIKLHQKYKNEAIEIFKNFKSEDKDALISVADFYRLSNSKRDQIYATLLYKHAAKKEHLRALEILTYRYLEGLGTNRDADKALKCAKILKRKSGAEALAPLFWVHHWIADHSHERSSQYYVGLSYLTGQNTNRNEAKARFYLEPLAEENYKDAIFYLQMFPIYFPKKDWKATFEAWQLLSERADYSDMRSIEIMAQVYEDGHPHINKNSEKSIECVFRGAEITKNKFLYNEVIRLCKNDGPITAFKQNMIRQSEHALDRLNNPQSRQESKNVSLVEDDNIEDAEVTTLPSMPVVPRWKHHVLTGNNIDQLTRKFGDLCVGSLSLHDKKVSPKSPF